MDLALDFESVAARGSALGTASIIVMDDSTDMVKVAHRLMQFYQNESCGKCTPCREGTRWMVQVLARIEAKEGTFSDLALIEDVCSHMAANSFCPLAAGAAPPVVSAMAHFKSEFEAYIGQNIQASRLPVIKISYPYAKT
jgi:NADH-quinone oxidoreductase subunit F